MEFDLFDPKSTVLGSAASAGVYYLGCRALNGTAPGIAETAAAAVLAPVAVSTVTMKSAGMTPELVGLGLAPAAAAGTSLLFTGGNVSSAAVAYGGAVAGKFAADTVQPKPGVCSVM